MTLYDFRLRFKLPKEHRIDSNEDKIDLLVIPHKETITLTSGIEESPIKNHDSVAIVGKSYNSIDEAKNAAEKSKRALLYWSLTQRSGIDFGDGKQKSAITKAGLALDEKQLGCPVRNDIHGIDVYEHADKVMFHEVDFKYIIGRNIPKLIDVFQSEYTNNRNSKVKQLLASEIYASSFFDITPRTRFITLVTAIEALLEPQKRPDQVETLITEFEEKTKETIQDSTLKFPILSALELLKYHSHKYVGRELVSKLIPTENFDGKTSSAFFSDIYDLRSKILHEGISTGISKEIDRVLSNTELLVNHLLLASFLS
jgi:hypothetical protein